jgi:hypothetical protein
MLRTCQDDGTSYGGFRWPLAGPVKAPDWDPEPRCGGGLHGLLWGCGDPAYLPYSAGTWQIVSIDTWVDLDGKIKAPGGEVVFSGTQEGALAYLDANGAADKPVVYAHRTAGDRGTATAGDYGTATAGDSGTATAGYYGTLVIKHWDGKRSRLVVGYIGEGGLLPDTPYRLNEGGYFVEATP